MGDIKKKYDELKKKYSLPSYEEMDKEFEINRIDEEENFLLREVRKKICEKIEFMCEMLDKVLQPEAHLVDMHECNEFSDKEKENLYELYKKLMWISRFSIETSINEDDKKSSAFINEAWKKYSALKNEFAAIARKLKESWEKETVYKEELKYLG